MDAVTALSSTSGVLTACEVLGMPRASYYRQRPRLGAVSCASARTTGACRAAGSRSLSPPGGTRSRADRSGRKHKQAESAGDLKKVVGGGQLVIDTYGAARACWASADR